MIENAIEVLTLQGEKEERWLELCRQAAVECDSDRLVEIVAQINCML